MKHLVLVLGLVALPTKQKQKSLLSPTQPLTPYIQTNIQTSKPTKQLKTKKTLVDALILVESAGNPNAFNKKENACGCLQIRPIMVREVNRILRKQNEDKRFTKENRWDCGLSQEMFYIWRDYHHKNSSDEVIARNWNGGPRGYKKQSTEHYWNKVQKTWVN
jgi:hypothetical protein